jgi:hypothetical protein
MATLTYEDKMILLMKHSRNRAMIQILSKKKHEDKLDYELKKLSELMPELKDSLSGKKTEIPNTNGNSDLIIKQNVLPDQEKKSSGPSRNYVIRHDREIRYDSLPDHLKKIWDINRESYSKVRSLHEKLKLMMDDSDNDRQPIAAEIVELSDAIRKNWAIIDAYDPDNPDLNIKVDIDHKKINANRTYISRNTKKVELLTGQAKDELLTNIQLRYDELKAVGESVNENTLSSLEKIGIVI